MKTLAKVLHKGGKTNTKLYAKVEKDYRSNTSISAEALVEDVRNLSKTEQNQLRSMKFEDSAIGNLVDNALSASVKETPQANYAYGERY